MWMRLLYQTAFFTGLIAYTPFALYKRWKSGKSTRSFWQRFGFHIPHLARKEGSPIIWLHAVSVGETRAIIPLAKELMKAPRKPRIVLSSITEAAHQEAKRLLPDAACHLYLPFDLSFCMRRLFARIRPDAVILCEGDFWFNFLSQARKQGAKLFLVNGKLSEASSKRYGYFPAFREALFSQFSLLCLQSEEYEARFLEMGVSASLLKVVGNMKFEMPPQSLTAAQKEAFYAKFAISPKKQTVVIGSTHDPEEAFFLNVCLKIWEILPNCQFILAPRHSERCKEVAELIESKGIAYARYSQLSKNSHKPEENAPRLLLVDEVGHLRDAYAIADVAIVAGSFLERVGGHNILEPALYAVPAVFGPHMWGQKELAHAVLQAHAGKQVTNEELPSTLLELLMDEEKRKSLGSAGYHLLQKQSGSTERTLHHLRPFLTLDN